jgi:hypothetical protein
MLDVTWIAPVVPKLAPLALLEELGRIDKITGVAIKTTTGEVLLDNVAAALSRRANLLVWSGHGVPGGLLLSNRHLVRPRWLATQVARGCRPSVAILAACDSQVRDASLNSFAAALSRQGVNVVGFPAQATDAAAGTFIVEFIRSLALGTSVMDGFDDALEAISDQETARGVFLTPGLLNIPVNLEQQLQDICLSLQRLEHLLGARAVEPTSAPDQAAAVAAPAAAFRPLARGLHSADNIRGLTSSAGCATDA